MIAPQTLIGLNGEPAPDRPCFNELDVLDIITKSVGKENAQKKELIDKIMNTCKLVMAGTASELAIRNAMAPYTEYELDLFCISNFEICDKLDRRIAHWVTEYGIKPTIRMNSLVIASDQLGTNFICEILGFNKTTATYTLSIHPSNSSRPDGNLLCGYENVVLLSEFFDPNQLTDKAEKFSPM